MTIDAIGCQKEIAKNILEKKADYVFCLKNNHPNLRKEVEAFFEDKANEKYTNSTEKVDGDHGRIK